MSDDTPALRITGLRYAWGTGDDAFRLDVPALTLPRRQSMLLSAPSGGGKSTLLSLIAGLIEPQAGTIEVAGQNVHAFHGAARDRFRGATIGMIFQTFQLLTGFSARENVLAALMFSTVPPAAHDARAGALLERLGITRPHARVETLSVGQQQRVAVARALACEPVLVLADEPTASLDPARAMDALGLIESACAASGAALLCVSHDPAVAARFERRELLGAGS